MRKHFELAKEKGFHDNDELVDGKPTPRQMLAWLALIRSENDEMDLEIHNYYHLHGKPEGRWVEAADVIIRCCDSVMASSGDAFVEPVCMENLTKLYLALSEAARDGDIYGFQWRLRAVSFHFAWLIDDESGIPGHWYTLVNEKYEYNKTRPRMHGRKA